MVLSVSSARCSALSTLGFGILFDFVAGATVGFRIFRTLSSSDGGLSVVYGSHSSNITLMLNYWFYMSYPILISIWSHVTGSVGVCATNPRRSENKCLIATFCVFSLVLIGITSYAISDYTPHLKLAILVVKLDLCDNSAIWHNCYLYLSLYVCFIFLAALLVLFCIWNAICCVVSLLCSTNTSAQDVEQVLETAGTDGVMMQGNFSPMCNPAMQGSMEMMNRNLPMTSNSGTPVQPTMQSNVQYLQRNAPTMPNSGTPYYPTMQGNVQTTQGNAPTMPNSGTPIHPTMQGNVQTTQGNAPTMPNSGTPIHPTMQGNVQGNVQTTQGNSPTMSSSGASINPTMQGNVQTTQVYAPTMPNSGTSIPPPTQGNAQTIQTNAPIMYNPAMQSSTNSMQGNTPTMEVARGESPRPNTWKVTLLCV